MNFLNAQGIINYAREADIHLIAQEGKLKVDAPKGQISPQLHHCLLKHKQQILEILTYHGFTLAELQQYAEEDWHDIKDNRAALISFAQILQEQKTLKEGKIPERFSATTFCISCNKNVKVTQALANGGKVLSCPWCHIQKSTVQH